MYEPQNNGKCTTFHLASLTTKTTLLFTTTSVPMTKVWPTFTKQTIIPSQTIRASTARIYGETTTSTTTTTPMPILTEQSD